jgi:glycosyltransferase involved in cell wall biosynthesis
MNAIYYGYVFEPTGYGEAARAYIHALHQAGINLSVVSLGNRQFVRDSLVESLLYKSVKSPVFRLCHAPPNRLATLKSDLDRRVVALTAWEADRIPDAWIDILNRVSDVWVPCSHNVEVFERSLKTSIFGLPHPFVPCSASPDASHAVCAALGLKDDDFVFYSILTWQERKNPLGIIDAFLKAFAEVCNVVLVLKTRWSLTSEGRAIAQLNRTSLETGSDDADSALQKRQGGADSSHDELRRRTDQLLTKPHHRIRIIGVDWPQEWLTALAERGNAYVSLHHGEGWCYPLFDAACRGIPVVATKYSGPTDYLTPEFHSLVDCHPTNVTKRDERFNPDMLWAAPDLSHAAYLMRYIYENPSDAFERARMGALQLRDKYSLARVGEAAAERLKDVHSHSAQHPNTERSRRVRR